MRILPDINALAIQLLEDHPGHQYFADELGPALQAERTLLMFGYLPLRIQWVLEDLDVDTDDARNVVTSLLQYPMEATVVDQQTIRDAYEISAEKDHYVYDYFYLALARANNAEALVTTDRDFEGLCDDEPFEYINPVPDDVLREFDSVS